MEERPTRKQTTEDDLDRDLIARARERIGPAALIHPLHMYWSTRFVWEGLVPAEQATATLDYEPLPLHEPEPAVATRLPERFVAVKAYFNECVPDTTENRAAFAGLVRALASQTPVVLLEAGTAVDDHDDWGGGGADVVGVGDLLRPETNLAQQAAVVARAEALVSTYGGFSYLGPFLGVPTVALAAQGEDNPLHERVLRAALPQARFTRLPLDDSEAVRSAVGRAVP